jgi:hypothetical protein
MAPMPDRTTLVYMLVVAAFLALVLFSNHPSHHTARKNRRFMPGRRIKVRVASVDPKQHEPIAFDPIIAEYERRREDRAWEKHYFEQQYKKWAEMEAANQATAAAATAQDADSSHLHVPEKVRKHATKASKFSHFIHCHNPSLTRLVCRVCSSSNQSHGTQISTMMTLNIS